MGELETTPTPLSLGGGSSSSPGQLRAATVAQTDGGVGLALRRREQPQVGEGRRGMAEVALRRIRSLLREKRMRLADLWKDRRVNELDFTRPDLDPAKAPVRTEGKGVAGSGGFCDMTDYVRGAWAGTKIRDYTRLTWSQFFEALCNVGLALSPAEVEALTWYVRTTGGTNEVAAINPLRAKFVMVDELEAAIRVSRRPYVGFSAQGSPLQRAVEATQASAASEYLPAAIPNAVNSSGMRFPLRRQPQSFQRRAVAVLQPGNH